MKKKKYILLILIVLILSSLLIFCLNYFKVENKIENQIFNSNKIESQNITVIKKSEMLKNGKIGVGILTIESIGIINENVIDGVSDENLKLNICHFPNTPIFNGNVCLAAHNYNIDTSDLFRSLENIKIGELVKYETDFGIRDYKVYSVERILETELSVLDNTDDNIITMITCVNDRKDMRLCVKAIEVKEEV